LLNEGQSEVFIYLALLRWARRHGTLDARDPAQFDTTQVKQTDRIEELKKLLKLVRMPLIPAETIYKFIYPGGLVEMEDLFLAAVF
jgi:hypothetical protein